VRRRRLPSVPRRAARVVAALAAAWAGLAAGGAGALPAHPCLDPGADCTLREIASAAGVRVGAAAAPQFLSEPGYAETLAAEFNSITAENAMKWPQIHPAEDAWDFEPADTLVGFAQSNDMTMRGHTLLWANPERIPDWVGGAPDAETLRAWLSDHIETVVGRYAGTVDSWDVVNEPLQNFGADLYDNPFRDLLGDGYIAEAFQLAHAADPTAKLFLNEVLVETPNARFDAFYELVAGLVADGVPIHGVGLQGHVVAGLLKPEGSDLRQVIESFAALGLEVEITEFDVVMPASGEEALEIQAGIYAELLSACLDVAACTGVTFWGFTDAHTWTEGTFGDDPVPLPFDESYARKPAYYAAREALLGRLAAVPEPPGPALAASAAVALAAMRAAARRRRR
jgi:endo-1,4-beta-xylanase